MNKKKETKVSTFFILFLMIPMILGIFTTTAYYWSSSTRNLPKLESSDKDSAIRGSIITKDGFSVANSQKLYKVMIDTRSIDQNKLDLFVKLYSIYTDDSEKRVKQLIQKTRGSVVLSYKVDAKVAMHLKELAYKLNQKKVFISFLVNEDTTHPPIGMSILESGENREYLAKDSMSPFLGYVKKVEVDNITRVEGVKGVEKFYDYYLSSPKDGVLKGPRDIGNNIILDKDSQKSQRVDGYNVILNIPMKFQKKIEDLLSTSAKTYDAKEIVVGIIDSKTGEILSLATSLRYNPSKITKKDYNALNLSATEYSYEAGSVMKPLVFSILYESGKIKPTEIVKTYNGTYKLGSRIIRDTHPEAQMSAEDVIVNSSNIGMIVLSSRLDAQTFYDGLVNYNLSRSTNIDIPYEQKGNIPTVSMLNSEIYKATTSYGYGLQTTFMQILTAYTTYNNDGAMISPRIVNSLEKDGKKYIVNEAEKRQVITKESAKVIKQVLIKTVQKGTGRKGLTAGLDVGGKTGTARIAEKGGYSRLYNSSFFGFANDENVSYTIGVLVREPKKGSYYAAQNALPIFKKVVDMLVEDGYLKPKITSENININQEELDKIMD